MNLTPSQRKAKTQIGKNLCVCAGAGSGKTQVLAERFIYLADEKKADIDRLLTITFTEKAASEMKERIVEHFQKTGRNEERRKVETSFINTIHGFSARLLYENAFEAGVAPNFEIMDSARSLTILHRIVEQLVREAYSKEDRETIQLVEDFRLAKLKEIILTTLDKVRSHGRKLAEFQDRENPQIRSLLDFARMVEEAYELEKRRTGLIDYEDLQIKARDLLKNKDISSFYRNYFQYILIDEFQDTNPLQKSIVDQIKRKNNLFVVGDAGQSIYGFRNAEVKVFTDFQDEMESQRNGEVIKLHENFRSRPEIIKFLNFFFGKISPKNFIKLKSALPFPHKEFPSIEFILVEQEEETLKEARVREAELIADKIKELANSFSYRDIAILFRSTTSITTYERVLEENGIPYFTVSGRGFYTKRELAHILSLLRAIDNPRDDIALASILKSPFAGINDDTLYWLARRALIDSLNKLNSIKEIEVEEREKLLRFKELFSKLRDMREDRLSRLFEFVIDTTNYDIKLLTQKWGYRRYSNIKKFQDVVRSFQREPSFRLKDFLNYMDSLTIIETRENEAQIEAESADVVRLMTIHKAKGLEFPAVFVADMGRERISRTGPVVFSLDAGIALRGVGNYKDVAEKELTKEREEELRILYVAMTRAKEHLILSGVSKFEDVKGKPLNKLRRWIDLVRKVTGIEEKLEENSVIEAAPHLKVSIKYSGASLTTIPSCPAPARRGWIKVQKRFIDYLQDAGGVFQADLSNIAKDWNIDMELIEKKRKEILARIREKASPLEEDIISTGVSQLLLYANCPLRYHMKYNLGMPEVYAEAMDDEPSGTELGQIVHRILEKYEFSKPTENQLSHLVSNESDLKQDAEVKIRDMIDRFIHSEVGEKLKTARKIKREVPFILKLDRNVVQGRIDCLYQNGKGEWAVVDYKTNDISPEEIASEAKNYSLQLWLYALAILKIKKLDSVRVIFYFLTPGKAYEEVITQESLEEIQKGILRNINLIKANFFEPRAGSWCRHCQYKKFCELNDISR